MGFKPVPLTIERTWQGCVTNGSATIGLPDVRAGGLLEATRKFERYLADSASPCRFWTLTVWDG